MFAANLKSFIHHDSFKLTKNVYCSIYRSGLLENIQTKSISRRYFITKFLGNTLGKPLILTVNASNLNRQITTSPKKKEAVSPIRWKTILIVAVFGSAFLEPRPDLSYLIAFFSYLKNEKLKKIEAYRNKSLGKAQIGGKFNLVDQNNKPISSDDLLGNWLLLYFGFTHCPDICPDEIEKMVEVINTIDQREDMIKVKPIFITVDPERDTPGVIKKYLKEFSDKLIGLTGSVEQIAACCKAFRVYFSPGPKDSDADYIVDHSIIMYLIDPEGKFIDYYGQNKNAKEIVHSIYFNQMKQNGTKSTIQKVLDLFRKE